MRRTSIWTAALTALTLAGCGGPGPGDPTPEELVPEEESHQAACSGRLCDLGSLPVLSPTPALDHSLELPRDLGASVAALRGNVPAPDRVPEIIADVDNNGFADVLGFGRDGTWVVYNFGSSTLAVEPLLDFGYDQGWRKALHVRTLADVNGDGRLDIVGFGRLGVYISLATGSAANPGFGPITFAIADFGYDQGWRTDVHERLVADVDGDRRADIVAFGRDGVWLARSTGTAFEAPRLVLAGFGNQQGWSKPQHVRTLGDVDGDGRADIVGFGTNATSVALSTGAGFGPQTLVIADLAYSQGWRTDLHLRRVQDVNGDGRADLVAFGFDGLWIARRVGNGYESPRLVLTDFGTADGWGSEERNPRFLTDLNADGYIDVVGFGEDSVVRALGSSAGFSTARQVLRDLRQGTGRGVADVDHDGLVDVVAVSADTAQVRWGRSTTLPPLSPPSTPIHLHVVRDRQTALDVAWLGTAYARSYVLTYAETDDDRTFSVTTAITDHNITGLHSGSEVCVRVQAENAIGISRESPPVCHTMSTPPPPTSGSFAITFYRQPQGGTGPAFYRGDFGPIAFGRLLRLSRPPRGFGAPATTVVFPRYPFSTQSCNDPTKVVLLPDGGSLGLTELTAIFGHAPQVGESARLAACYGSSDGSLPQTFFVNADWGP